MQLRDCDNVLVFGGTFDPPHHGHVALPMMAAEAIGADAVAYVPARVSPFKQTTSNSGAHHRLAMLRLAVANRPRAHVLTDELDQENHGEPSYTVDTLRRLRERLGDGPTFRLLIGADQVRRFDHWKEPETVIKLAEPVVMLRPPDTVATLLSSIDDTVERDRWRERIVKLPRLEISSTDLRQRMAEDRSVTGLLPRAVEDYARRHGLYHEVEPHLDEHLMTL